MKRYSVVLFFILPLFMIAQVSEQTIISKWNFRKAGDTKWFPATIPGTVHTDLLKSKQIPDPFFGNNEKKVQWIENENWEYETKLSYTKSELSFDHIEMIFDGLDTYAKIFLNDTLILEANNMFVSWKVDVKRKLKVGENRIRILFESVVKIENAEAKKMPYRLPDNQRVFTRKAAFQYGWDFAPRIVTSGIWKDIKLKKWNLANIENCRISQNFTNDSTVIVQFDCRIKSETAANFFIGLSLRDSPKPLIQQSIKAIPGDSVYTFSYRIINPKRWWCNGMGDPDLYKFSVILFNDKKEIDKCDLQIGLRTLELVKEKDSKGESFYFKLNGIPVFMKGANYVPPDIFLPRISKSKYETIISDAVDANMNMLRVWGGGVYADDEFYDLCDEKGILVWQDFMFAGAMYPGNKNFTDNVLQEVKQQVIRLRNHPCIALWCGNNEIDEAWNNWGWQKEFHISKLDSGIIWNDYVELFQNSIPDVISENDGQRRNSYISSSPTSGWGRKESLTSGDCHYWGVWWGNEPFENYNKKVGRFMSEYGFQSFPSLTTIRKFVDTSEINIGSESLLNHQKHATGNQSMQQFLFDEYNPTNDFKKHIYLTQMQQAHSMKIAIEAHRRNKPYCMGSLFWQFNDCWPSVSWSTIDYYNNKKASYFEAKRSFRNLIFSVYPDRGNYEVHVISDSVKDIIGSVEIKIRDMRGKLLFVERTAVIPINKNSAQIVYVLQKAVVDTMDQKKLVASCILYGVDGNEICNSIFTFVKSKELGLLKPSVTITKINDKTFSVKSDVYVKDMQLQTADPSIQLNDNFIDLLPGKTKIIQILSDEKYRDIEHGISFMSMYDLSH